MNNTKQQILAELEKYFNKYPHERFCQAIYNLTYNLANDKVSKDIFCITDEEMINILTYANEHIPNKETKIAIQDSIDGKGKMFNNEKELFKDLEL